MKMTLCDAYSAAYISGQKCIREANDVEENPGATIFDITDNNNQQPLCLLTLVF